MALKWETVKVNFNFESLEQVQKNNLTEEFIQL